MRPAGPRPAGGRPYRRPTSAVNPTPASAASRPPHAARVTVPSVAAVPAAVPVRRGLRRAILEAPLLRKLVLADLVINVSAFFVMREARQAWANEIMLASLMVTLVLNAALVYWALLPLRALEATARRVSAGDLAARVPLSPTADRDLTRIGVTLNTLLDGV